MGIGQLRPDVPRDSPAHYRVDGVEVMLVDSRLSELVMEECPDDRGLPGEGLPSLLARVDVRGELALDVVGEALAEILIHGRPSASASRSPCSRGALRGRVARRRTNLGL